MAAEQEVEVLADGGWHFGMLRAWSQREDGWWAHVTYSLAPGDTRLDTVPAERVRRLIYCPWYRGHHQCLGWDGCTETLVRE